MLEIAEGNFTSPAPVIAFFDVFNVKRGGKVGDNVFIGIVIYLEFEDAQGDVGDTAGIQQRFEVRDRLIGVHIMINVRLFLHDFSVFISKESSDSDVKFL